MSICTRYRRDVIHRQILREREEQARLQTDLKRLTEKLVNVNEKICDHVIARNQLNHVVAGKIWMVVDLFVFSFLNVYGCEYATKRKFSVKTCVEPFIDRTHRIIFKYNLNFYTFTQTLANERLLQPNIPKSARFDLLQMHRCWKNNFMNFG